MRLVSLNAWGGQVWPELRAFVETVGADIFCLQEMIRAPEPSPDWLIYVDPYRSLQQRANLFADISAALPDHQARFAPAIRGKLTDDAGNEIPSEHGLGFWASREIGIVGAWQGFAFGAYRTGGWGAEPVPRAFQLHRLCDPTSGRTVVVGNIHGIRDPAGKMDTPERAVQAENVIRAIAEFREDREPVILAGDLNLLPGSATFGRLAEIGLKDLVTGRGHTDTRTVLYKKSERFADYILVTAGVEVDAFDIPPEPVVSDHRPLILDFRL